MPRGYKFLYWEFKIWILQRSSWTLQSRLVRKVILVENVEAAPREIEIKYSDEPIQSALIRETTIFMSICTHDRQYFMADPVSEEMEDFQGG